MDQITRQKEFDRAVQRAMKKKSRKGTLLWLVIIILISVLLSFLVYFTPIWYDLFVRYQDPVYRPMDIERQYKELDSHRQGGLKQY